MPLAVHTAGRLTAHITRDWSFFLTLVAFLCVGLGVGVLAVAILFGYEQAGAPRIGWMRWLPWEVVTPTVAMIAFVLPAGIVALGTRLLMPLAVRHEWIRIASWVIALMPVAFMLVEVVAAALTQR